MKHCSPRKPRSLIVTQILCTGIACPWTLEGWTADGQRIYVRFRWGILSISLGSPEDQSEFAGSFLNSTSNFQIRYGSDVSGSMDYWTLKDLTKGVIEWPLLCASM